MNTELQTYAKKVFLTLGIAVLVYGAYRTQNTLIMLVISGFFTILITPLVEKWKKYRIPEWLTIVIVYIGILLVASIIVGTIIPIVINYVSNVINQITTWSNQAQEIYMREGLDGFHLHPYIQNMVEWIFAGINIEDILGIIKQNAGSIQQFITNQAGNITNGGISLVSTIGGTITSWVFVGISTFFMILERKNVARFLLTIVGEKPRNYLIRNYSEIETICISWIRATAILSLSIFAMTFIGLTVTELIFGFRTENVFTLALIGGIMEFIPYIGPILSLIPALIIGLGISWEAAVAILVLYIIIQQLENNFLVPYIMSKNLDISPFLVFIIMLVGGTLGGLLGIILSVPIAGILKVLYTDFFGKKEIPGLPKDTPETPQKPRTLKLPTFKKSSKHEISEK